jgi:type II secretory pathway predicted ATPase ExeA
MYERHFGFTEKPFNLTPDPRYLFLSPKHQEAYANLEFGVRERNGFLLLTGEVGTGKTTLVRHFLSQLGPDVRTAVILYPALSAGELFHAILQDLDVPFAGGSLKDAVDTLANALIEAKALHLKVVVLIDEAQNLKPHVLEQLRLLSNLETEREKLITLVLVGQPELRDLLDQPVLRQLSQRITSRSHLEPLTEDETRKYVKHRLLVAGGLGSEFDEAAVARVHEFSGGVPRVVNVLCDRALVGAFGRGQKVVDEGLVLAAAAEVLPPRQAAAARASAFHWPSAIGLFLAGLLLMLPMRYCVTPKPAVVSPSATTTTTATPIAPPTPQAAIDPLPSPSSAATAPGGLAPTVPVPTNDGDTAAVRCGSVARSRTAAISAIEGFLGTPGFDSAQATLTFEQWRALKLPAIVPFRTAAGPCEAAVMPIDSATTRVSDATGEYVMKNTRLQETYLGSAIICFVDRDGVLAKPERARFEWARKVLERRGTVPRRASDAVVTAVLGRVGERVGLKDAVSVEGALLAALYSIEGGSAKRTVPSP